MNLIFRSMVFGGRKQTTQDKSESEHQVIVAAATRNSAQVIQQNNECTKNKQGEHQDRDPSGAHLDVLGNGRGIASRSRNSVLVVSRCFGTGLAWAGALGSRASA
jgi:hypothetical protein